MGPVLLQIVGLIHFGVALDSFYKQHYALTVLMLAFAVGDFALAYIANHQ